MSVTDPIADMLTRIRNAIMARHDVVFIPASKLKISIAKILKEESFIRDYEILRGTTPQRVIKVHLSYTEKKAPMITALQRVSKPSLRVYAGKGEIPRVYGGLGLAILSTPFGVMTGKKAWHKGVGGEVLCSVW